MNKSLKEQNVPHGVIGCNKNISLINNPKAANTIADIKKRIHP